MSNSGSSTSVGCCRPKGIPTMRIRKGGTSGTRSATSERMRRKPSPPGSAAGSKTMVPMMWRWVVGDSRARKAPSRPVKRAMPSPARRPEAVEAPFGPGQGGHLDEVGRLHLLDDELGDPVPATDAVGDFGVGV